MTLRWLAMFLVSCIGAAAQSAVERIMQQGKIVVGGGLPLRLDDVLESVERHYPPLLVALQERPLAEADLLAARGRFDLNLRARVDTDRLGYYSNTRVDAGVDQPLMFQGMNLFSGYRVGEGLFAPYDGKLDTRSLGEIRTGIRLPLLRDRAIDPRRAELTKAQIGVSLADLSIDSQKIVITQMATRRYWDWVAAGRRYAITLAVLDIAIAREKILEDAVREGQLAAIEVTDNRRAILQRQTLAVEARRAVEQAAIELSLYLRDGKGNPLLPALDRVPAQFPEAAELTDDKLSRDLQAALRRRPEIARLEGQRDQTDVDIRLARNSWLPWVDLVSSFTSEGGNGTVRRGPQELRTSLVVELPFQRRAATARFQQAQARLRQINERERFTRDQVQAEVRDAASAVNAAFGRVQVLREEVEVSRQLESAEGVRFELGEGTLFILNLRELATAEAAIREVTAEADYQNAVAQYDRAIAAQLP